MPFPKTIQAFGHGQDNHAQASPAGSHPHWHMLAGPAGPAAQEWLSPWARSRLSLAPQTRVTYARGSSDIPKSLSSLNSPKHGTYVRIYHRVFIFCRCFKGCVWIWCLLTHTVLCIWWTRVRFHKWASLTTKNPACNKNTKFSTPATKSEHPFHHQPASTCCWLTFCCFFPLEATEVPELLVVTVSPECCYVFVCMALDLAWQNQNNKGKTESAN